MCIHGPPGEREWGRALIGVKRGSRRSEIGLASGEGERHRRTDRQTQSERVRAREWERQKDRHVRSITRLRHQRDGT